MTSEQAPDFEALICDGEAVYSTTLDEELADSGGVLFSHGFSFSAVADNWWSHADRVGWDDFDIPVFGVSRDGPYAQNAFIRSLDSPFRFFSDIDGVACEAYDLLVDREGMVNTTSPCRAAYVLDGDRVIEHAWMGEDWSKPVPWREIQEGIERL
jgi:alkyl hydroperoxide reductase subunit AhpC